MRKKAIIILLILLLSACSNNYKADKSGCDDPKIKGNISSNGEKIYHVPGNGYYDSTDAEEMFCTENEAKAYGYRKSNENSNVLMSGVAVGVIGSLLVFLVFIIGYWLGKKNRSKTEAPLE